MPFLLRVRRVGEVPCLCSLGGVGCASSKEGDKVAFPLCPCRMNVLATGDESYLKTCRYSTEHPYCPIFLLGNIVQWAGSDFQEMASEVGVPLGLAVLLAGGEPPATASCPGQTAVLALQIVLVPLTLSPGTGAQGVWALWERCWGSFQLLGAAQTVALPAGFTGFMSVLLHLRFKPGALEGQWGSSAQRTPREAAPAGSRRNRASAQSRGVQRQMGCDPACEALGGRRSQSEASQGVQGEEGAALCRFCTCKPHPCLTEPLLRWSA